MSRSTRPLRSQCGSIDESACRPFLEAKGMRKFAPCSRTAMAPHWRVGERSLLAGKAGWQISKCSWSVIGGCFPDIVGCSDRGQDRLTDLIMDSDGNLDRLADLSKPSARGRVRLCRFAIYLNRMEFPLNWSGGTPGDVPQTPSPVRCARRRSPFRSASSRRRRPGRS